MTAKKALILAFASLFVAGTALAAPAVPQCGGDDHGDKKEGKDEKKDDKKDGDKKPTT